jgi:hypothetical protein
MICVKRAVLAAPLCVALSSCTIALHGHQSTSGGVSTTTTSSNLAGGMKASGAKVSFSSGPAVPANAPGGQVVLSRGAAAVLILGLVIADAVNFFSARLGAKPQQLQGPGESIAETCSCYRKESDEMKVTR